MSQSSSQLISVIIPVFNAEKTIERAVESVLNQTHEAIELIVVNDDSTDSTPDILLKLCAKNSNLKIINQVTNRGVSYSRNKGIESARGVWITFLDADDYFSENYIQSIKNYLQQYQFICTSYVERRADEGNKIKDHRLGESHELTDLKLLKYMEQYYLQPYEYTGLVHCWNKFFLRKILHKNSLRFDENMSQLEDVKFVSRYLQYAEQRIYVNQPGIFHNVNTGVTRLSAVSGMEKNSLRNLFGALKEPDRLKRYLLRTCSKHEEVSFQHFTCSMVILFCIRITRRFWKSRKLSDLKTIYDFISHPKTRALSNNFRLVEGESKLILLSLKYFPSIISVFVLVLLRR